MQRSRLPLLPALISAIFLTACADDDHNRDDGHATAICGEAGCDAGDDDVVPEEDGAVSEPTPEHDATSGNSDTGAGNGHDAAASEDASSGTDAGSTPTGDAGGDPQVADAGSTQLDSGTTSDAGSQSSDAGSSTDANTSLDANTNSDAGSQQPEAGTQNDAGSSFVPVRFNNSGSEHGGSVYLSDDRLSAENRGEEWGNARSDAVINAGSGVFYFEAHREIETLGGYGVGIATAAAPLSSDLYSSVFYQGLATDGGFIGGPATCTGALGFQNPQNHSYYGFVVDYRGSTARLHYVLDDGSGGAQVVRSCTTTLAGPVYILYSGARWEVGFQMRINTGADTTNHPFEFSAAQVRSALTAANEAAAAAALVPGFARTRALPLSADPVLAGNLAARDVAAGASVTITATASDAEDGNLTSSIRWLDLSTQHHAPLTGTGGSFTFTAGLGRHPIVVSVRDSVGRTATQTVMVNATGTIARSTPVRMVVDDGSDPSTTLISEPDGLLVDVRAATKKGVRCNQGIYGAYWYFEATRRGGPVNEGVGLMIREGSLNPYDFVNVPWSMSINLLGNSWYNLNSFADWAPSNTRYGFAVDYRGIHPIVHILIGGAYHRSLTMKDVWTPLYPIVYGNPDYTPANPDPGYDIGVNFGASAFFVTNPATVLQGAGVDTTGLVVGWGL